MIVLRNSTYARIQRAIKYVSITGGQGVRVNTSAGGTSINIPPTGDGGGLTVGGPTGPQNPPDYPVIIRPPVPPYDPYEPSVPS